VNLTEQQIRDNFGDTDRLRIVWNKKMKGFEGKFFYGVNGFGPTEWKFFEWRKTKNYTHVSADQPWYYFTLLDEKDHEEMVQLFGNWMHPKTNE
jgi:hypothetical protein